MTAPTFAQAKPGYEALWAKMRVTRVASATATAKRAIAGKGRYQNVEKITGVPWYVIALMHYRECDFNWKGVLHNGELIVGTGRKTKLVPKGKGPFATWEAAAADALKGYGYDDWGVARICYVFEKFNGFGYRSHGIPSPYLWGGSTVQRPGKYVRDGVYNPKVMDTQLGCMTVLRQMMALDPSISLDDRSVGEVPAPVPMPKPAPLPVLAEPSPKAGTEDERDTGVGSAPLPKVSIWRHITGWLTAAAGAVGGFLYDYKVAIVVVVAIFLVIAVGWLIAGPKIRALIDKVLDNAIKEAG